MAWKRTGNLRVREEEEQLADDIVRHAGDPRRQERQPDPDLTEDHGPAGEQEQEGGGREFPRPDALHLAAEGDDVLVRDEACTRARQREFNLTRNMLTENAAAFLLARHAEDIGEKVRCRAEVIARRDSQKLQSVDLVRRHRRHGTAQDRLGRAAKHAAGASLL